ncbi:MAG: hypothetical protein AAGI69_18655 [Cyanobacteria bacterium P01_H01_bin.21]
MDRVKSQAAVVSQLLFDPKTAGAYKDVLTLTGKIIKEVALLAWLLICSVLVFGAWFGETAIGAGRTARAWWQTQQTETTDGNQAAAATGQAFLDVSQSGANFLVDKAREQLGLEKPARPAKESTAAPVQAKPAAKKSAPATAEKVAPVVKEATVAKKSSESPKAESETPVAEKH